MQIVIPLEGRVRTVIRSSFVAAKRLAENQYTLSGDNFQMTGVTAEQVLILPDTVGVSEGQTVTDEMKMQALPFEGFIAVSAEEALPAVLGLLLRSAVADGGAAFGPARAGRPRLAAGYLCAGRRCVRLRRFSLALHSGAHHAE